MAEVTLPPPVLGIDNRSSKANLAEGAVRTARNVDIAREGVVSTRKGARLCAEAPGAHSLHAGRNRLLAAQGSTLCRVDRANGRMLPIGPLASSAPLQYCETPLGTVYMSDDDAGFALDDDVMPLAPENGRLPAVAAVDAGELSAGTYGVGITYLIGNLESALSPIARVEVAEGQGIKVTIPEPDSVLVDGARLYRTSANGREYYQAMQTMPGGAATLGNTPLGRPCDTRNLAQITHGKSPRLWNGRLVCAQGSVLVMSEPLRYGLWSPQHRFVQFPSPITLVAPTDGALFVADNEETVVLAGRSPEDLVMSRVQCGRAAPFSDTQVPLDSFNGDWATTGAMAATWLTSEGYVVGTPDGAVIAPQKKRFALRGPMQPGKTAFLNRRFITG